MYRHYIRTKITPTLLRHRLAEAVDELNQLDQAGQLWAISDQHSPELQSVCRFYETFYSNMIEGNILNLQETHALIMEQQPLPKKLAKKLDAMQMANHYALVANPDPDLTTTTRTGDWIQAIQNVHGELMAGVAKFNPGKFVASNVRMVAGDTEFISPEYHHEVLHAVHEAGAACPAGLARATVWLVGFVNVHPFLDGNGRVSRLLANAELQRAGLSRFIMHHDSRDDHIISMRSWYGCGGSQHLIQRIAECQQWTQGFQWHSDIMTNEIYLRQARYLFPRRKLRSRCRERCPPPKLPSLGPAQSTG